MSKWVVTKNGSPISIFSAEITDVDVVLLTLNEDVHEVNDYQVEFLGGDPIFVYPPGCQMQPSGPVDVVF